MLVRHVDDLCHTSLDDQLAALVAREQRGVDRGHALGRAVQQGVRLRVDDVRILCVTLARQLARARQQSGVVA